jgi:hypothetical protein
MSYDPARLVGVIEARQIFLRRIFKRGKLIRACGRESERKVLKLGGPPASLRLQSNGTLAGSTRQNDTPPPSPRILSRPGSRSGGGGF